MNKQFDLYSYSVLKLKTPQPIPQSNELFDLPRMRAELRQMRHVDLLNYLCDRANCNCLDFDDTIWYHVAREVVPDLDWDNVHITYRYLSQESYDFYGVTDCTWCYIMKMGRR